MTEHPAPLGWDVCGSDHWFGLGAVVDRFPNTRALALPAVIEHMKLGSTPEFFESFWKPRFDGKLVVELGLAA
jgi:hypothetical protein